MVYADTFFCGCVFFFPISVRFGLDVLLRFQFQWWLWVKSGSLLVLHSVHALHVDVYGITVEK